MPIIILYTVLLWTHLGMYSMVMDPLLAAETLRLDPVKDDPEKAAA